MAEPRPGQMRIGRVLEQARVRSGLDLGEIEERTRIRRKYLQALEHEEWAELPGGAYAKGFLRTYGELLGLDGESLVDEYRRQVETEEAGGRGYPPAESPRDRTAAGPGPPRWWPLVALGAVAGAVAILVIVLGGDDAEDAREPARERKTAPQGRQQPQPGTGGPVELALVVRAPVEVCLIGGGGSALIDGQVLAAGTRESYTRERFELGFPSGFDPGGLRVEIGGRPRRLPAADGPAAYEITAPARVTPAEPRPAEDCP